MTRLLRGAHRFADEALRTFRASGAMLGSAGLDIELVVSRRHEDEMTFKGVRWRPDD
jgi:hypothetical protein